MKPKKKVLVMAWGVGKSAYSEKYINKSRFSILECSPVILQGRWMIFSLNDFVKINGGIV